MALTAPTKYIYTSSTGAYLTPARTFDSINYVYLPETAFSSSNVVTTPADVFNPVVYLYLNPELSQLSNIHTVEEAFIYYDNHGTGMLSNMNLLPAQFDYRIFDVFNSNVISDCNYMIPDVVSALRSNVAAESTGTGVLGGGTLKQLSIISYLRHTSNLLATLSNPTLVIPDGPFDLVHKRDPLFSPALYRMLQNINIISTDDEMYLDYINNRSANVPVIGKADDFRLAIENYHSGSLNVYSNLTVQGDTYLSGLRGVIDNVDLTGDLRIHGRIFASSFEAETVHLRSLFLDGDITSTSTILKVSQKSDYDVLDFISKDLSMMKMASNGYISISSDGISTAPEANLDVDGDVIMRRHVRIEDDLTTAGVTSSSIYVTGTVMVDDVATLNGGCTITSPYIEIDPYATALTVIGELNTTQMSLASDARIKKDVCDIDVEQARDIVSRIRACHYIMGGSQKRSFGVIGQELEAICSQLVSRGPRVIPDGRVLHWRPESNTHALPEHGLKIGDRVQLRHAAQSVAAVVVDAPSADELVMASVVTGDQVTMDASMVSRHVDDFVTVDYIQLISLLTVCVQDLMKGSCYACRM